MPHAVFGDANIIKNSFQSPLFQIIELDFGSMYKKLDSTMHLGHILLSNPDLNIASQNGAPVE